MHRQPAASRRLLARSLVGLGVGALGLGAAALPAPADASSGAGSTPTTALYLVTLDGPGTGRDAVTLTDVLAGLAMRTEQDIVLAGVDAGPPVYRWTHALDGVAVRLTAPQAAELRSDDRVAMVERDDVRRLATVSDRALSRHLGAAAGSVRSVDAHSTATGHGGAGVVIGMVDTGLAPDSPLFATVPGLGPAPSGFHGTCASGPGWPADTCDGKIAGAAFFVSGFGADHVRSASSLSPMDGDGHGTEMASIAAGNTGTSVRVAGHRLGSFSGAAPRARLAIYKACWTAPDPRDDGCSAADLVSAIDRATADGVDVLNLSVGGPSTQDTVERALLGATEAGITVVAAAGNDGARDPAAHESPWVTTVGGTTGVVRRGVVHLGALDLTGAMAATRGVGPARLVLAARAPAPGSSVARARTCAPGSLDAGRVGGRIVLCARGGGIARVAKSAAVAQADGVGMVLANTGPGSTDADFQSVPTVHVTAGQGRALRRAHARHPGLRISLQPLGADRSRPRVVAWTPSGDPAGTTLKPDLVAPATGVLAATSPALMGARWSLVSGTSAATAATSGQAALLIADHPDWDPADVHSALVTTAVPIRGASPLQAGSGRALPELAQRPGLLFELAPDAERRWLAGRLDGDLNTPSVLLSGGVLTTTRTVTNVTRRSHYFSSTTTGFHRDSVLVTPAALRLAPGQSATFTVQVLDTGRPTSYDDGWVVWRGATGTVTRIPVVVTR